MARVESLELRNIDRFDIIGFHLYNEVFQYIEQVSMILILRYGTFQILWQQASLGQSIESKSVWEFEYDQYSNNCYNKVLN